MQFFDPKVALHGGYDVHCYFQPEQVQDARLIYNNFLEYLKRENINPTYSYVYDQGPNYEGGPHNKCPSWVVQLVGINPTRDNNSNENSLLAIQQLGFAVAWLSLNRQGFLIMIHPNTAMPFGDVDQEIQDHTRFPIWMGVEIPQCINLPFFEDPSFRESSQKQAELILAKSYQK
jgi:aromatic ring-cleaving dioxygenase